MKILFIIPGSGDSFYCGNCFRDNLQASALRKAGQDVIIMPLYLPLKQKSFRADTPLFFPATTFYVAQKFFKKTKTPHWIQRITGSDKILSIASSLSGTTSAEGMEDMTLSMITGEGFVFKEQVMPMIDWIREEKPDVIHLSSTLLLGITKTLRQYLEIPVICSVLDEEVWIDSLKEKDADIAWRSIANNISHVDHFVTTSEYYKAFVKKRVPEITKIEVIYPGMDIDKYASSDYPENPTIGFFYRMNHANGLDILVDAYVELKRRNTIPNLKLKIGGGYSGKDKKLLNKIKKVLLPYKNEVEIFEKYTLEDHVNFYRSISVISVPLTFDEGASLFLCEAFAAGRPAVEPSTGSFPEIVDEGGLLYEPNNSEVLANALEKLLSNQKLYLQLVEKTNNLSFNRYNERVSSEKLVAIYKQYLKIQK